MAPPIIDVFDETVFVNSTIPASDLFSISGDVETYLFEDFQDRPQSGYFSLNGVAYDNGSRFTIAAADLGGLSYIGGPNITYEGFRVVAYNAAGENSNSKATGRIYSTRSNTTAPHVLAPRFEVVANEVVPGSAFIFGNDPDGFPMESYTITEASKVLNLVASGGFVTVTSYKHNFSTSDSITIRGADQAEFNTTAYVAVLDEHRFRFKAAIADGVATGTMLASANEDGGFFLNGVRMPAGIPFNISPDQISQLEYAGAGLDDQKNIHLVGFDGALASYEKRGEITTRVNANAPVVQFSRAETPADQELELGPSVDVVDADGNSIKAYRFYNTSPHPENGDVYIYGVKQPKLQWLHVDAKDLGGVTFLTPRAEFTQQIRVMATDGKFWSGVSGISVTSTLPIIRPELVADIEMVRSEQLQSVPLDILFSKVDVGTPHTKYQIYEDSPEANSGNLRVGPTPLAGGVIHEVSAAQFDNASFYTGDYFVRNTDSVYTRVKNDEAPEWSRWEKVNIHTEPEIDDLLTTGATWNGILPRNSVGKLQIPYSFMQSFPDYGTGEAVDNDPPEHFAKFTEAQRDTAREWFRHMESFASVQFVEVADSQPNLLGQQGGIIRMANYGLVGSNAGAFAFYPSLGPTGGDMWFNRQPPDTDAVFWQGPYVGGFNADDYSGYTFIHELGHAMGMKHSFTGNPNLPPETDVSKFTVMSYTRGEGYSATYGLYDIAELQREYGTNWDYNTEDNVYSIANTWERQAFTETVWDGGGTDVLSAVGSIRPAIVDLRQGQQSTIGIINGGVSIAYKTEIENAYGSGLSDSLIGNPLDNLLVGHGGNDRLFGGIGDDYLLGSAGNDTYVWGVGDQYDIANEQGNGDAADVLEIAEFPTVNRIDEDFRFVMDGNDLLVNLHLDGGPLENSFRIKNQAVTSNQIETLLIRGVRVDLVDLFNQVAPGVDQFTTTGSSSANGALVVPVV